MLSFIHVVPGILNMQRVVGQDGHGPFKSKSLVGGRLWRPKPRLSMHLFSQKLIPWVDLIHKDFSYVIDDFQCNFIIKQCSVMSKVCPAR